MTRLDFKDTDRFEPRFHESSAKRGFTRGGALLGISTVLLLLTGWYTVALFGVPVAVLFIGEAYTHRLKARALRAWLPVMSAPFVFGSASSV